MSKVREPEPEGFEAFWSIWLPVCRDSDGRPKAREAFRKHVLMGVDPQDIIDAALEHIYDRKQKDSLRYIQLASSWLNQERYEFECIRWRERQQRLREHEERKANGSNVVSIKAAPLPDHHFSRQWAERQKAGES